AAAPLVLIELALVGGKRGPRQPQSCRGLELNVLVPGPFGDEDDEAAEVELALGRTRKSDVAVVRRIERPAEQTRHWTSMTSPATSTSSPLRAPAAFSAASSSASSSGTSPAILKPRSVRRMRKRRPPGRGR